MMLFWRSLLLVLPFLLFGVSAPSLAQAPFPTGSLNPRYSVASLSPNGQFLALTTPQDGGDRVAVIDIIDTSNRPVAYPIDRAIITDTIWRGNEALVIRVFGRFTVIPTPLDLAYLALPQTTEPPKQITFREQRTGRQSATDEFAFSGLSQVVDVAPELDTHFFMAGSVRRPPTGQYTFAESRADIWAYDLLRVEADDGVAMIDTMGSRDTAEWIMDGHGNVLARIDVLASGRQIIMLPEGDRFFELTSVGGESSTDGQIVGLAHDARSLVIRQFQGDEIVLYPIDLTSGEQGENLFSGPNFLGVMRDEKSLRVIGARYGEGLISRVRYFEPDLHEIQTALEDTLAGHTIYIRSTSTDRTRVLFEARAASRPPVLGVFDVAQLSIQTLAEKFPEMAQGTLGPVSVHAYPDVSGAMLGGVLVLPPGDNAVNLPTIILDDTRTGLEFDERAHFLASHGYAVLRPGVPAARGLGELSGMGELTDWVSAYQDSVASGLNELVAKGIADPGRVCIIGTGENGYSALMSVVNSSDLFKCAIGVNGIYDLQSEVDDARRFSANAANSYNNPFIRNHDFFLEEDLEQFSPVNHADSINAAVLVIGTDRDGRAPSMETALDRADKDVELVELEDNFNEPADAIAENRVTEYEAIVRFLSAQLGG